MTVIRQIQLIVPNTVEIPAYQRGIKPRRQKIRRDFHEELFGLPVVSLRDGHYYAVDGMQRLGALRDLEMGEEPREMSVFDGLTVDEEYDMYEALNKETSPVSAFDLHRGALSIGKERALRLEAISAKYGYKIARGATSDSLGCVKEMYEAMEGRGNLELILYTTTTAWPHSADIDARIVGGLSLFFKMYADIVPTAQLITMLKKSYAQPNAIKAAAAGTGSGGIDNVRAAIAGIWNRHHVAAKALDTARKNPERR